VGWCVFSKSLPPNFFMGRALSVSSNIVSTRLCRKAKTKTLCSLLLGKEMEKMGVYGVENVFRKYNITNDVLLPKLLR
jgi:hypothetical protein